MREGIDIRILRRTTWVCVIIIATVAIAAVTLSRFWFPHQRPLEPPDVAAPQLETRPQMDLQHYQHAKQQQLDSYAWVDAAHGIARIPLDEAMRAMATRTGRPPSWEQP